jgi:hypothetical protein
MADFEQILEDCLDAIESGAATIDECLARYPEHAARLKPLLQSASRLGRGRELKPSPILKSRIRTHLTRDMKSNPRRKRRIFPFWRIAVAFAIFLLAFLATGTVYAQDALPGDVLYNWKLTSERAWRVVSVDHVGIDLRLADRRLREYVAVSSDPVLGERALKGYREVLGKLQSEVNGDTEERIRPVFEVHQRSLKNSGLNVPELDTYLAPK